jgi:hypothetical protein
MDYRSQQNHYGSHRLTKKSTRRPLPKQKEMPLEEELKTENAKLREIVERYRVWSTSENPTQMELDDLKQKYDELN